MSESKSPNRPPNYNSRSMQFRLLVLVSGLMLVLVMMDEARKPKNWMWMGFESVDADSETPSQGVSPRLADLFSNESADNSLFQALVRESQTDEAATATGGGDVVAETRLQLMRRCFQQLSDQQLQQLFVDLNQLRSLLPLLDQQQAERFKLADRLDRVVQTELEEYRRLSRRSQEARADAETGAATWEPLLEASRQPFTLVIELLRSGGLRDDLTVGQLEELIQFQGLLDQVAVEQIEDNTLGPREREQHAWYRIFELMQKKAEAAGPAKVTRVTSFDLAEQPEQYRGRWVEIQGDVRELKRVSLKNNRSGFQDYWELWVRPLSGPDVPICVYTRQLPEGFPRPTETDQPLAVKEPVTIDGCFFKKHVLSVGRWVTRLPVGVGRRAAVAASGSGGGGRHPETDLARSFRHRRRLFAGRLPGRLACLPSNEHSCSKILAGRPRSNNDSDVHRVSCDGCGGLARMAPRPGGNSGLRRSSLRRSDLRSLRVASVACPSRPKRNQRPISVAL